MMTSTPRNAEILKQFATDATHLTAVRSVRRGHVRLLLVVDSSPLRRMLGNDEELEYVRRSEFSSEAELFSTFDRAALALAS